MEQKKKDVPLSLLVFPDGKVKVIAGGGRPLSWIDDCLTYGAVVRLAVIKDVPIPPEKPILAGF